MSSLGTYQKLASRPDHQPVSDLLGRQREGNVQAGPAKTDSSHVGHEEGQPEYDI